MEKNFTFEIQIKISNRAVNKDNFNNEISFVVNKYGHYFSKELNGDYGGTQLFVEEAVINESKGLGEMSGEGEIIKDFTARVKLSIYHPDPSSERTAHNIEYEEFTALKNFAERAMTSFSVGYTQGNVMQVKDITTRELHEKMAKQQKEKEEIKENE